MKAREKLRYHSDAKAEILMEEHNEVLSDIELYAPLKLGFDNEMTKLRAAMQEQAVNTSSVTENKGIVKVILSDTMYKFTLRAGTQAHILNKVELEKSLNIAQKTIINAQDDDALTTAIALKTLMQTNSSILTCLLPADFTAMNLAITNFQDIQLRPEKTIEKKKSEGTDPIPGLLREVDVYKKLIGNLFHSYLPEYAHDWDVAVKVGSATSRHTSIVMQYFDLETGVPIIGVITTLTNGMETITRKSTKKGSVRVYSLQVGNWSATSEHPTYPSHTQNNIGVTDEKTKKYIVKLLKIVPPPPSDDNPPPPNT